MGCILLLFKMKKNRENNASLNVFQCKSMPESLQMHCLERIPLLRRFLKGFFSWQSSNSTLAQPLQKNAFMCTVSSYTDKFKFEQDGNQIWNRKGKVCKTHDSPPQLKVWIWQVKILRVETFCFITLIVIGGPRPWLSTNTVTDASTMLITVYLYQVNSQFAQVLQWDY